MKTLVMLAIFASVFCKIESARASVESSETIKIESSVRLSQKDVLAEERTTQDWNDFDIQHLDRATRAVAELRRVTLRSFNE